MSFLYKPSRWGEIYHNCQADEVLGAGAAGPGKTTVLLMDPVQRIHGEMERCMDPDHPYPLELGSSKGWALHLRRTTPMLSQTVRQAEEIFVKIDPKVRWKHDMGAIATFSSGYRVQFDHCSEENDWQRYFSNEYDWIGFDELVQFTEEQYEQIRLRCRSSDPVLGKLCRVRSMSNPMIQRENGDRFIIRNPHWVRDRFVAPAPEGGVLLVEQIEGMDGEPEEHTRIYLPARLDDNPDERFRKRYYVLLKSAANEFTRRALLAGDWWVTPGSFYAEAWDAQVHTVKPFTIPADWPVFRSMDWGFKAPGIVHWWAVDPDETLFCWKELKFQGKTEEEMAQVIEEFETANGLWAEGRSRVTGPADTQIWEERGDSKGGKSKTKAAVFAERGVAWVKANKKSRQTNAGHLIARLRSHQEHSRAPGIVFFDDCHQALETIPSIQTDPHNTECPADGGNDHAHDSVLYACAYASFGRAALRSLLKEPNPWDKEDRKVPKIGQRGRWGYGSA